MRIRASRSIFQRFFRIETLGGFVLLLCATCALLLANSPFAPLYTAFWHTKLSAGSAGYTLTLSLHECVNDGLMTIFFLVVGLEIKRELLAGELASPQKAALPIAAAVGGMVVPVAIFLGSLHALYCYLVRRFRALDAWLLISSTGVATIAVIAALAGISMAACLVLLMLAPTVTVVAFEVGGYQRAS